MPDPSTFHSLLGAVERYFDLMFDSDVSRFDQVFAPSAQLHGLRDGNFAVVARTRLQACACLRTIAEVQQCSTPAGLLE